MSPHLFDLPPPVPPGRGEATPGPVLSSQEQESGLGPHYRVREWATDGTTRTFPKVYDRLEEALDVAEKVAGIEPPHRRPQRVTVFDVWTGEIMRTIRRDDPEAVPGVCRLCGQPTDPFADAGPFGS